MRKLLLAVAVLLTFAQATATAEKPCSVPKSWGQLRSFYVLNPPHGGPIFLMLFEDEAGTVRVLQRNTCKPRPDLDVARD